MTEAIATDMLRSYIDRILRLKTEQDELAADIREIYAEAKANGYDKTGIGNVVSHVRQRDKKGTDAVAEANAIFALYLSAYDGTPSRAHAHAREESLGDSAPPDSAVVETPKPASGAKEAAGTHHIAAPEPDTHGATTPRVGQREQPARGRNHDDLEIPEFLRRTA